MTRRKTIQAGALVLASPAAASEGKKGLAGDERRVG